MAALLSPSYAVEILANLKRIGNPRLNQGDGHQLLAAMVEHTFLFLPPDLQFLPLFSSFCHPPPIFFANPPYFFATKLQPARVLYSKPT
jgi:hypothetical protein